MTASHSKSKRRTLRMSAPACALSRKIPQIRQGPVQLTRTGPDSGYDSSLTCHLSAISLDESRLKRDNSSSAATHALSLLGTVLVSCFRSIRPEPAPLSGAAAKGVDDVNSALGHLAAADGTTSWPFPRPRASQRCSPHSVLPVPAQRPSRGWWPSGTGTVVGAHPMDTYPT